MARKLQSDKWMFLATLALVCASVVMVYSASALVALERFQQPYLFVTKQVMWVAVGVALLSLVMRVDYRTYKNERLIWTLLVVAAVLLAAVLFSRPVNGTRRWFALAGFGIQPSELAKLAVVLFAALLLEAADAPHQRRHLFAPAHRARRPAWCQADPARARLRDRGLADGHRQRHGVRGRAQLQLSRRRGAPDGPRRSTPS